MPNMKNTLCNKLGWNRQTDGEAIILCIAPFIFFTNEAGQWDMFALDFMS